MAHGSKRWIVTYDGSIKRSSDRTHKDYYRGLKWETEGWTVYRRYRSNDKNFCPQCKHVVKAIRDHDMFYNTRREEIEKEWKKLYGDRYWVYVGEPKKTLYWYEFLKAHPRYISPWEYHWRNYLCWKCERKAEVKDTMWRRYPGKWKHYTDMKRDQRRKYRSQVRQVLQRARYVDDAYDDIPNRKHEWLD